jgi:sulfatase maturation enzyme AslB (radical SAM superfamily)
MFGRIISLLPGSPFSDIRSMVEEKQHAYPKNWFYKPIGIEVEITNKCNLKCAGCGQRDETIRPEDILTTEDYIDIILQASNTPIFACSITGGETLLFLERVKQILQAVTGQIDIYKINSNSYRFVTQQVTLQVLEQLKAAGFGQKNHTIKSVLVTSIGQQNENGMPLKNSVNLVSAFYKVFDFDSALVTVNATDQNMQKAKQWLKAFQELYTQVTGSAVDEQRVPFRAFMLNNVPTLERLQLMIDYQVPIQDLIDSFKQQYVSWKCLNMLPVDPENELTTLTPRCVLRPNGDLYACPGYNYTHKLGNLREHTLQQLIEMANHNPLLESVFREGLSGLLKYAAKIDPSLKKEKLSLSYAPCDVCQHLSNIVRTYQQV